MSHPKPPEPCLFFCGILIKDEDMLPELTSRISGLWGGLEDISGSLPFSWTDYYETEFGPDLRRIFLCFSKLLEDPSDLSDRKHRAFELEEETSRGGKRRVNLDPGYLNGHQVIIATFKPFAHRIAIGGGVFAHLEYIFKHGEPIPLPWTYPDYQSDEYRSVFRRWRKMYMELKRQETGTADR